MKRKSYYIRPTKASSAVGAVMSIIFLIIGLRFMGLGSDYISSTSGSLPPGFPDEFTRQVQTTRSGPGAFFSLFKVLWILFCLFGFVMSLYNIFSRDGVGTEIVSEISDPGYSEQEVSSLENRLREIQNLKTKGLISEEEYQQKRKEILSSV